VNPILAISGNQKTDLPKLVSRINDFLTT